MPGLEKQIVRAIERSRDARRKIRRAPVRQRTRHVATLGAERPVKRRQRRCSVVGEEFADSLLDVWNRHVRHARRLSRDSETSSVGQEGDERLRPARQGRERRQSRDLRAKQIRTILMPPIRAECGAEACDVEGIADMHGVNSTGETLY